MNKFSFFMWIWMATIIISGCQDKKRTFQAKGVELEDSLFVGPTMKRDSILYASEVGNAVKLKDYFGYIDSVVSHYDSLTSFDLSEHLLVHANPWIIDSLIATDYYIRKQRGEFVYDQKELVILKKGDVLHIPDSIWAKELIEKQKRRYLDVNVPEFVLRIKEGPFDLHRCTVRVGQNRERYLATAGRTENLRTKTGEGIIWKIKRDPIYMNPVDGHRYQSTVRDDGRRTQLPQIPFLHPEINGHRWGQLIHPTTNPETLGKPYSNGCIGTSEEDAWRIYYYAPVGTRIVIRYDLEVIHENGDTIQLKSIYPNRTAPKAVLPGDFEIRATLEKEETCLC